MNAQGLGWLGVIRLGLVQSAIGALAVFGTVTLNRVMVVELALPAALPASLVAWHYVVQLSRPRWGHGGDAGARRTPWILFGAALLALGTLAATNAVALMAAHTAAAMAPVLAVAAFAMIGAGVSACGTSLLSLMADLVAEQRRPAAAAIAWVMMIFGIAVTAGIAGHFLDPFSPRRLALLSAGVAVAALLLVVAAVSGLEQHACPPRPRHEPAPFMASLASLWRDTTARGFTLFVFAAMLAYSAQELLIEPYAGVIFGYRLGAATQLTGWQHGGVLCGMVAAAIVMSRLPGRKTLWMRRFAILGCALSGAAVLALAQIGLTAVAAPLPALVMLLGAANGVFAVSALGWMMSLANVKAGSTGLRMGAFGAAQAAAFACGGFLGAGGVSLLRASGLPAPHAFAAIFTLQAGLFLGAGVLAWRLGSATTTIPAPQAEGFA